MLVSLASYGMWLAGSYAGRVAVTKTFTPIHLWELCLKQTALLEDLPLQPGFTTLLLLLQGSLLVNQRSVQAKELVMFSVEGERISIEATSDALVLLLHGQPIAEPIVGQGPFVMNTQQELAQAFAEYRFGRF